MQAVEALGGDEARDRVGAAFDQHTAEAGLPQGGEDCGRRDIAVGSRQRQGFDA